MKELKKNKKKSKKKEPFSFSHSWHYCPARCL